MNQRFQGSLRKHRLIAILRDIPEACVEPLGESLVEGGIRLLEVALSNPATSHHIRRLRSALPSSILVGAGTVTSRTLAEDALNAGAEFLVTPHVTPDVNAFAVEQDLGLVCGALTPTEIAAARETGSTFVKVFPASAFGPSYFRALAGPYPGLELIAVGGINATNLEAYLRAGASGAGIGGALAHLDENHPDYDSVRARASNLVQIARATFRAASDEPIDF